MTPLGSPSRRRLLAAGAAGLAAIGLSRSLFAQPNIGADDLAYVHPDLRSAARNLRRAETRPPTAPYDPARIPLPAGVRRIEIAGASGAPPVPLYLGNEDIASVGAPRGAVLFLHGGGFVGGTARLLAPQLRRAKALGYLLAAVDYRLAPATPFPGALEDCYAALLWLHDHAHELGIDRNRIALLGESAGGGHAAMLAIAARDRGQVRPCFQALVYPMLDDRTGSSRRLPPHIGTLVWKAEDNRKGWSALLGRPAGSANPPAGAVPAREQNLVGLPPAWIGVGGIDLFAEEDIDYARRLNNAGVPVELIVVPGAFHGFEIIAPQSAVAQQFVTSLEKALARALAA